MNEVATTNALASVPIGPRGLQMRSVGDLMLFIQAMRSCGMAPDNKGENDLLIRAHYGMSLGLDPMRAVQSIYVVRNRPCVWGAAIPGLILASGKCKRWEVSIIGQQGADSYGVQVVTERNDVSGVNTFQFTMADARRANLLGKDTWKGYPADMMRWKAIGRAATSVFGDVLYGLSIVENERDIEEAEVIYEETPTLPEAEVVQPAPAPTGPSAEATAQFAAACAAAGREPRAESAAMIQYYGATNWANLTDADLAAYPATWAPAPSPLTPVVTATHPDFIRFKSACEFAGVDHGRAMIDLLNEHNETEVGALPAGALLRRAAEIETAAMPAASGFQV